MFAEKFALNLLTQDNSYNGKEIWNWYSKVTRYSQLQADVNNESSKCQKPGPSVIQRSMIAVSLHESSVPHGGL